MYQLLLIGSLVGILFAILVVRLRRASNVQKGGCLTSGGYVRPKVLAP
jgi:hypothetical protein